MMFFPIFLTSFGFTLSFAWIATKIFPRIGLLDKPSKYGLKRHPLPYPGGLSMLTAFILCALLLLPMSSSVLAILSGAIILGLTSFVDDRHGLPPWFRLLVQALAALLLVIGGIGITSISNPFGETIVLDAVQIPVALGDFTFTFTVFADLLTILWVMVMVNAFNWIDGVPGMANSVAAVAAVVLLLLSTRPDFHFVDQTLAISISSIVLGLSLAHLIFDFPPPRMILGDTGSMLLGFLLAAAAISSGGKIATTLLVLGFPILDFIWVISRRIFKKQSPFKGDLGHFHHRLLRAGLSEGQVVIFFATTAAVFGSLALMLHTEGKLLVFAAILGVMAILGMILYSRN